MKTFLRKVALIVFVSTTSLPVIRLIKGGDSGGGSPLFISFLNQGHNGEGGGDA